jgi:hypothetical protein
MWLRPRHNHEHHRHALARLPEPLGPALVLAGGVGGWIALTLAAGPAVLAMTLFGPMAFTTLSLTVLTLLWFVRACRRHAERVRRALVASSRCPGCLYDLRDARASDDACTRCPECGGAWDLSPPTEHVRVVVRIPSG